MVLVEIRTHYDFHTTIKMRLSNFFIGAASILSVVSAIEGVTKLNFDISYSVVGREGGPEDRIVYDENDVVHLMYTAVNHEDRDVTIVGISGTIVDPTTHDVLANLTTQTAGPYVITPGMNFSYGHKIPLSLTPGAYNLAPVNFLSVDDDIKIVPLRVQPIVIAEVDISPLEPKFLFLQLCLSAATGAVIYWAYQRQANPKITKKQLKEVAKAVNVDDSWLPETYSQAEKPKAKGASKKGNKS